MLDHSVPAADHSQMPALLAQLGAVDLLSIDRRPLAQCPANECYRNVARQVTLHGGAICYGWMVVELDHLALMAWHHAIWRDTAGRFTDISAHPRTGSRADTTLFAIDPRQHYRLDWPLAMPLVVHPLVKSDLVRQFGAAEAALHLARKKYFDLQMALPSASYSSAGETVTVTTQADSEKLRDLESEWTPRIGAAERNRNNLLADLQCLQQKLQ